MRWAFSATLAVWQCGSVAMAADRPSHTSLLYEEPFRALVDWLEDRGVDMSLVRIDQCGEPGEYGSCLRSAAFVPPGQRLFTIPADLAFHADAACAASDVHARLCREVSRVVGPTPPDPTAHLAALLAFERFHNAAHSPWTPLLAAFPDTFTTSPSWDAEAVAIANGSLGMARVLAIRQSSDALAAALADDVFPRMQPHMGPDTPETRAAWRRQARWGYNVVITRAYAKRFPNDPRELAIVPLADMMNHDARDVALSSVRTPDHRLVAYFQPAPAAGAVDGQELFATYSGGDGDKCIDTFVASYGFVPRVRRCPSPWGSGAGASASGRVPQQPTPAVPACRAPQDPISRCVSLELTVTGDGLPAARARAEALVAAGVFPSATHPTLRSPVFHDDAVAALPGRLPALPPPLMLAVRVTFATEADWRDPDTRQRLLSGGMGSLESERRAVAQLRRTIQGTLDAMPTSLNEQRAMLANPNRQLTPSQRVALQFAVEEKEVLSHLVRRLSDHWGGLLDAAL